MRILGVSCGMDKIFRFKFIVLLLGTVIFMAAIVYMFNAIEYDKVRSKNSATINEKNDVVKGIFFANETIDKEEIKELLDSLNRVTLKFSESKDMFDMIAASINRISKYVEANEKNITATELIKKEDSKNGFIAKSLLYPCKYKYDGPVYILLTTTPDRINNLEVYLNLLHGQTYGIKEIILSVPYKFERTGHEYPPIPEYLLDKEKFPLLRIIRGNDYGPATKFLLPIEIGNLPEDSGLVILDDDTKYSRHLVCDYIYVHKKFPDSALGRRGQAYHDKCDPSYRTDRLNRLSHDRKDPNFIISTVDLLSGVGTYFIQKRFIDKDILTLKKKCPKETIEHMFFTDDIYISGYLAYKNISRIVFSNKLDLDELNKPYMLGSGPGALWSINKETYHNENSTVSLGLYWGCKHIDIITSKYENILCKWDK
ncbi:transmembrane protein [Cryptosporidium xiaoi]|uniref:Transmembrane protein n=1 Tax=Cryptosporidium xiaoi TaxID=659607 RepID=A0AAV9XU13_9CRYT